MCECGSPIDVKKSGECKKCYAKRWYHEHADKWAPGGAYYRPHVPAPPRVRVPPPPSKAVGYDGAHNRVRRARGLPSEHLCPCGQPAQDWSYNGDSVWELQGTKLNGWGNLITVRWSTNVVDYTALCKPCHTKKDMAKNS